MFRVGQRVVCVKLDSVSDCGQIIPDWAHPKVEDIVTIERFELGGYLLLKEYDEIHTFGGQYLFDPTCFRPFSEFGEKVLMRIAEEIEEEQLIEII